MVASKKYRVDSFIAALAIKAPCIAVSNTNLTLSGQQTVNGIAVVAGDRVLVKDQTNPIENGIYDVETSAWGRAADFDGNRDVTRGTLVTVTAVNAGSNPYYQVSSANPITIGVSAIEFTASTKNTTRVTGTYTILDDDEVIFGNTDGGAFTATLPAGVQGRSFKIINSGSSGNDLTLAPDGSEHLIGANTNFTLRDGETLDIEYEGTDGWY